MKDKRRKNENKSMHKPVMKPVFSFLRKEDILLKEVPFDTFFSAAFFAIFL